MALSKAELACVYAALVLVDDDVAVTVSIHFSICRNYHMAQRHITHTQRVYTTCELIRGSFFVSSKIGWKTPNYPQGSQCWGWTILARFVCQGLGRLQRQGLDHQHRIWCWSRWTCCCWPCCRWCSRCRSQEGGKEKGIRTRGIWWWHGLGTFRLDLSSTTQNPWDNTNPFWNICTVLMCIYLNNDIITKE